MKLAAVVPNHSQIVVPTHGTRLRSLGPARSELAVGVPQTFGDELFHESTDEPIRRISEQHLGVTVDTTNSAQSVHDHDSLAKRFENSGREAWQWS
jgi:hypothetical protein